MLGKRLACDSDTIQKYRKTVRYQLSTANCLSPRISSVERLAESNYGETRATFELVGRVKHVITPGIDASRAAQWSSSMIHASGVNALITIGSEFVCGPGFNSRLGPNFFSLVY